jgi:hypothetical protein
MPRKEKETVEQKRERIFKESLEISSQPRFGYFSLPPPIAISEDRTFAPKPRKTPSDIKPFVVCFPSSVRPNVLTDISNEPYRDPVSIFKTTNLKPADDRPKFTVSRAIHRSAASSVPAFSAAVNPGKKEPQEPSTRGIIASAFVTRAEYPYISSPYKPKTRPKSAPDTRPPFRSASHGIDIFSYNAHPSAARPASPGAEAVKRRPQSATIPPFRPAGGILPMSPIVHLPEGGTEMKKARPMSAGGAVPWRSASIMPAANPTPTVALSPANLRPILKSSYN